MGRACLSCGTVNPDKAKYCNKCGKPLASRMVSKAYGTQATRTTGYVFCKKCNKEVPVKGKTYEYREPDSPLELYSEQWEVIVPTCNHKIYTRKTGKKRMTF